MARFITFTTGPKKSKVSINLDIVIYVTENSEGKALFHFSNTNNITVNEEYEKVAHII